MRCSRPWAMDSCKGPGSPELVLVESPVLVMWGFKVPSFLFHSVAVLACLCDIQTYPWWLNLQTQSLEAHLFTLVPLCTPSHSPTPAH